MVIFGEKMLISAELKGCVIWFIYFLVLLWVRYNCAKFVIAGYVWQILGSGPFLPLPLIFEQPQGDPPWIGLTEIRFKGAHLWSILLGLWSNRWRTPVKMLILWKIISWQFLWYCDIIVISCRGYIATVFEKCHSRFEKRKRFSFSCDTFYTAFMQFELSWNENITSNYMGFRITGFLGFLILFFMKWQLW